MFSIKFLQDWQTAFEAAAAAVTRSDEITAAELRSLPGRRIQSALKAGRVSVPFKGSGSYGYGYGACEAPMDDLVMVTDGCNDTLGILVSLPRHS